MILSVFFDIGTWVKNNKSTPNPHKHKVVSRQEAVNIESTFMYNINKMTVIPHELIMSFLRYSNNKHIPKT